MVSDSVKFLVDAMVRQDEELRMLESDEDENSVSSLRLHEYHDSANLRRNNGGAGCFCWDTTSQANSRINNYKYGLLY